MKIIVSMTTFEMIIVPVSNRTCKDEHIIIQIKCILLLHYILVAYHPTGITTKLLILKEKHFNSLGWPMGR